MTTILASGSSTSAQTALLALLVVCYWVPYHLRSRTLAAQGRPVPGWRRACFVAGLIVCAVALSPPFGHGSQELLWVHMIEHLLIGDVGALLLVLGLTGPLLQPLLRIHWVQRLRVLFHPVVAVAVWWIDLYVWHLPVFYEAALRHDAIHALEHACFLAAGIVMWMALLGPLPKPAWFGNFARLGYIVTVRLIGTLLGNVFIWSGTVFYPFYIYGDAKHGLRPLTDQGIAGAVMMIEESMITLGLFAWLFLKAARDGEERQELIEFAAAHGVTLSEERAARAVAAGQGAELRRRLERGGPQRVTVA